MPENTEHVETWGRRLTRPRLTVYRAADHRPTLMLNRYGDVHGREGVVIGAALNLRGRVWSLTWAKPTVRQERVR